eukprot:ANDGO_00496.mRNA.1 hypothetical protein
MTEKRIEEEILSVHRMKQLEESLVNAATKKKLYDLKNAPSTRKMVRLWYRMIYTVSIVPAWMSAIEKRRTDRLRYLMTQIKARYIQRWYRRARLIAAIRIMSRYALFLSVQRRIVQKRRAVSTVNFILKSKYRILKLRYAIRKFMVAVRFAQRRLRIRMLCIRSRKEVWHMQLRNLASEFLVKGLDALAFDACMDMLLQGKPLLTVLAAADAAAKQKASFRASSRAKPAPSGSVAGTDGTPPKFELSETILRIQVEELWRRQKGEWLLLCHQYRRKLRDFVEEEEKAEEDAKHKPGAAAKNLTTAKTNSLPFQGGKVRPDANAGVVPRKRKTLLTYEEQEKERVADAAAERRRDLQRAFEETTGLREPRIRYSLKMEELATLAKSAASSWVANIERQKRRMMNRAKSGPS